MGEGNRGIIWERWGREEEEGKKRTSITRRNQRSNTCMWRPFQQVHYFLNWWILKVQNSFDFENQNTILTTSGSVIHYLWTSLSPETILKCNTFNEALDSTRIDSFSKFQSSTILPRQSFHKPNPSPLVSFGQQIRVSRVPFTRKEWPKEFWLEILI